MRSALGFPIKLHVYLDKQIPLGRLVGGESSSLQKNFSSLVYRASLWFLNRTISYYTWLACGSLTEQLVIIHGQLVVSEQNNLLLYMASLWFLNRTICYYTWLAWSFLTEQFVIIHGQLVFLNRQFVSIQSQRVEGQLVVP